MPDTITGQAPPWVETSLPFLTYLDGWLAQRPALPAQEAFAEPGATAIASVDVINGFCHEGPLASPRVKGIIAPIVRLFEQAWQSGVRHILLTQDAHHPQAVEFAHYPPHCVRGTSQAETVPEFRALPYFPRMVIFEKNSIHSGLHTGLDGWIHDHPDVHRYLVVGDCTDLCTYHLAMHLRLDANARQLERRVIVPVDCVNTYDLPVDASTAAGAMPHDAELLHRVFLYSLALNGVEVVARIA
jgi:nicotinamidase-related amidase